MSNAPVIEPAGPRTATRRELPAGLNGWQQGAVFLAACAILFARRPDAILHAQFYAEDGHVWFANAYNMGWWRPLLRPQDGYFQTFPRLGAALALLAPLALAPLVMNLLAIAAQALPVNLLLSPRSRPWGSLRFRALLALMFLVLPNCNEISLGITESQWMLAFSAFLLLVALPPSGRAGRLFETILLALAGLTGPFCIFLLPVAVWLAWKRGSSPPGSWRWRPLWVLAPCCAIQACGLLLFDAGGRPHAALGISADLFTRILGGNIILGVLLGQNRFAATPGAGILVLLASALCAGAALAAVCFLKSGPPMRLLLLLSAALFLASLVSSATLPPPGTSVWQILAMAGGARYWFFPSLAFAFALLWCARYGGQALRSASVVLLCALCFSVPLSWRRPALKDLHYGELARRFEAAPAGTVVVMPENPDPWTLRLEKRIQAR